MRAEQDQELQHHRVEGPSGGREEPVGGVDDGSIEGCLVRLCDREPGSIPAPLPTLKNPLQATSMPSREHLLCDTERVAGIAARPVAVGWK